MYRIHGHLITQEFLIWIEIFLEICRDPDLGLATYCMPCTDCIIFLILLYSMNALYSHWSESCLGRHVKRCQNRSKPNTGCRMGLIVQARKESGGRSYDGDNARRSEKGQSYSSKKRRRGKPAHMRSPDDTPLRDGNRDRLMGLLTERAAKTLLYYFFEMNPTLYGWFSQYLKENKIPRDGSWDDVSGETFLRGLLLTPIEETTWGKQVGVDQLFDCTGGLIVDPRNIAQRVMEIRTQIAKEWIEDLGFVSEENSLLMRETLTSSLSLEDIPTIKDVPASHPDFLDDSAGGSDD